MLLGISLGTLLVCLCVLCNRRVERLAAPFVCGLMLLEYLLAPFRTAGMADVDSAGVCVGRAGRFVGQIWQKDTAKY